MKTPRGAVTRPVVALDRPVMRGMSVVVGSPRRRLAPRPLIAQRPCEPHRRLGWPALSNLTPISLPSGTGRGAHLGGAAGGRRHHLGASVGGVAGPHPPRAGERVLDVGCGCGVRPRWNLRAPSVAPATWRRWTYMAEAQAHARGRRHRLPTPVAAFARMRSAATPGARIASVCRRPVTENPRLKVPMDAVSRHLPPRP